MSSRADVEARWARRSVSRESEDVDCVELEGFGFGGAGEEEGIFVGGFWREYCVQVQ